MRISEAPAVDVRGPLTAQRRRLLRTAAGYTSRPQDTLCHDGSSLRSDPIVSTCQKIPVASQAIVTTTRISSA